MIFWCLLIYVFIALVTGVIVNSSADDILYEEGVILAGLLWPAFWIIIALTMLTVRKEDNERRRNS